jgi:hypothetical protein
LRDLIDKIVEATLLIFQKYERKSMLQYLSKVESAQLLSVDKPIQKELKLVDQENRSNR